MTTADVKVGDRFTYTTPAGRKILYTVTDLEATTRKGERMPVSVSASGQKVFIHDELLAQDWWQPTEAVAVVRRDS